MPIPKPGTSESKDDFISRCMGDAVMVKEYPDASQRAAICHSQWDDKSGALSTIIMTRLGEEARLAFALTVTGALKALDQAARSAEPRIRRAFEDSVTALREGITQPDVAAWITEGNVDAAMDAINWPSAAGDLKDAFRVVLQDLYETGATTGLDVVTTLGVEAGLTVEDLGALHWAQQHAGKLVTEIDADTRAAIRGVIETIFSEGLTPGQAVKQIRELIGLREDQVNAVDALRAEMMDAGYTAAETDAACAGYAQKLLAYRADLIARTETLAAANAGQNDMWTGLVQNGDISPTAERVWSTVEDDRTCEDCDDMDEERAPLGEPFDTNLGFVDYPPLHPDCRCGVWLDLNPG